MDRARFDPRYTRLTFLLTHVSHYRGQLVRAVPPYLREVVLPRLARQSRAESQVYVHVTEPMGRFLFLMLQFLTAQGATVTVLSRMSIWDFMSQYGKLSLALNGVVFSRRLPSRTDDKVLITASSDPGLLGRGWRRRIRLNLDLSAPVPEGEWFMMPFPMHPKLYLLGQHERLDALRIGARPIKVLFAGNMRRQPYETFKVKYARERFGKLLRPEVIDAVLSGLDGRALVLESGEQMQQVLAGDAPDTCVLASSARTPVDTAGWLPFLAKSEFFLCPPGVATLHCHNVVEAMAVGCIPILNYGEWMQPALEHDQNCIAFGDADDLVGQVRRALSLPSARVTAMRQRVIAYYEEYLAPRRFAERVLAGAGAEATLFAHADYFHRMAKADCSSVILAGRAGSAGRSS